MVVIKGGENNRMMLRGVFSETAKKSNENYLHVLGIKRVLSCEEEETESSNYFIFSQLKESKAVKWRGVVERMWRKQAKGHVI